MLVPAHVFREYDIRGVADKELSDELIGAIGQEFAHALYEDAPGAKRLEIAVGRDCRLSSPRMFEALTEGIDPSGSGLSVVVDAGNGSAGPLGLAALKKAGVEPVALYCEMDGTFPNHHPDPTVLSNLAELVLRVTSGKASVGIAWDGDGD